MDSRFWAAGGSSDSDSDSDSGSDESSYSSDDQQNRGGNQNRWLAMSDSESSEDEVRVVKSGKERAMETFQKLNKQIRGHMKERDYFELLNAFDELTKAMVKAKQYLAQGVPRFLVRILVDLEDYVLERLKDKAQFKKLSARQGRSINKLKLSVQKHNRKYKTVMDMYRKNPDTDDPLDDEDEDDDDAGGKGGGSDSSSSSSSNSSSSSSSSSSSDSGSDSDKDSDKDSDDDDDDADSVNWDESSDSSSSSDDDDGGAGQLRGRARWLKKTTETTKKESKDKTARAAARLEAKQKAMEEAQAAEAITATKSIIPEENLTASVLIKKVKELAAQRGRKGRDNRQILRQLESLSRLSLTFGPRVEIPILMNVITAQFGLQRTLDDYMDAPIWKACASYLQRIADVLDDGYKLGVETIDESDLIAGVGGKKMKAAAKAADGAMAAVAADEKLINPHTNQPETQDERDERLRVEAEKKLTDEERKVIKVVGSVSLHMTRLEEEYTKALQHTSHHSPEYVTRLRDESKLVTLLARYQKYFEQEGMLAEAASMAQLRIEHIYYRHDTIAEQVERAAEFNKRFGEADLLHPACVGSAEMDKKQPDYSTVHPGSVLGKPVVEELAPVDYEKMMAELCTFVYKHGTEAAQLRAVICQIFHHAIHDRFIVARDLTLMSKVQDRIFNTTDVSTMVLFNRMMVNVGICAFRVGRIYDAHQCLSDICSGRVKELLAQGVNTGRFNDKSAEQEKAEKRRQVPYHQHINLDLLEACHLISAMLLEVPNMAAAAVDGETGSSRRRVISRTFRKFHDQANLQVFDGPPEQTRDFIMRASKMLQKGDWKASSELCANLAVWKLFPGQGAAEKIGEMLVDKVKLEALRTYLFTFSAQYDSLSLSQLCGMFEMTKSEVHSVVSKMMINRELHASWDQPTETIVLRKVEPTSLQLMALQYAEKASALVEANERLLDAKSGHYGHKDDHWKDNDDRWQNRQNYRGGQGHRHGNRRRDGGGGGGRGGGGSGRGGGGGRGRGRGSRRRYNNNNNNN